YSRGTQFVSIPNLNITVVARGTTLLDWYSGSSDLVFDPPEGGARNAIFFLTTRLTTNVTPSNFLGAVTGVTYQKGYVYQSNGAYLSNDSGQNQPPGWFGTTSV